jgi:aspartyl-tRNA(Asn)/glutamyl-tRNA(Gln) amidotransferase subunit A
MPELASPAAEIARLVRSGQISARESVQAALKLARSLNGHLNAFAYLDEELALAGADAVDATIRSGTDPGPLAGVPFGVKDLDDCQGMPTGRGSLWHSAGPVASTDSIHVARLRAAGAVPIGKTTVPEFGSLPYTSNKVTGVTRNPWNPARTPGGSSGGSAAVVAAGIVPFATASDGGGSTRTPASFCGLVGHKPSFGRIPDASGSRYSQTATPGCLSTTVADTAMLLDVMAGSSLRDRTALPAPQAAYTEVIESLAVSGLRVAWSQDLGFAGVDPEIAAISWSAAQDLIEAAGLRLVDRKVELSDVNAVKLQLEAQERWIGLADGLWPQRAAELTPVVRAEFERTQSLSVREFAAVLARRAEIECYLGQLLADVDVLLTPTTAVPAFPAEGPAPAAVRGIAGGLLAAVPFAALANLWGTPAISVPAGLTSDELPVGLHIIGRHHDDATVLRLARLLEIARPWPRHAPLSTLTAPMAGSIGQAT